MRKKTPKTLNLSRTPPKRKWSHWEKNLTILQCYYWEMWTFSQKFQNLEDSSPIKIAEEINHVVVECWSFWDMKRSQVSQPLSWSLQITNEVCWAPYPCLFIGFLATRHLTTGAAFPDLCSILSSTWLTIRVSWCPDGPGGIGYNSTIDWFGYTLLILYIYFYHQTSISFCNYPFKCYLSVEYKLHKGRGFSVLFIIVFLIPWICAWCITGTHIIFVEWKRQHTTCFL